MRNDRFNKFTIDEDSDSTILAAFGMRPDALRIEIARNEEDPDRFWIELHFDPDTRELTEHRGDERLLELAETVFEYARDVDSSEMLDEVSVEDDVARALIRAAVDILGIDGDPDGDIQVMGPNGNVRKVIRQRSPKREGWKRIVN